MKHGTPVAMVIQILLISVPCTIYFEVFDSLFWIMNTVRLKSMPMKGTLYGTQGFHTEYL